MDSDAEKNSRNHAGEIRHGKHLCLFFIFLTALTVTESSHLHQRVSAGDPDKQHSQTGDGWSVDNPVRSEGSQTSPEHVVQSRLLAPTTPPPTHLPSRQPPYHSDRNSPCFDVIRKPLKSHVLRPSRPSQLDTGELKSLSWPVLSGERFATQPSEKPEAAEEKKKTLQRGFHSQQAEERFTVRGVWVGISDGQAISFLHDNYIRAQVGCRLADSELSSSYITGSS